MPGADDPTPYVNPNNIGPQDYFGHRLVSSPLVKERLSAQSGSNSDTRRSTSIPRKPVGSPERSKAPSRSSPSVPRKPVRFSTPTRRKDNETSNTVIHTNSLADSVQNDSQAEATPNTIIHKGSPAADTSRHEHHIGASPPKVRELRNLIPRVKVTQDNQPLAHSILDFMSASQRFDSFLDKTLDPLGSGNLSGKEVTATLFRSASTSQAEILPPSDQSPKATSPVRQYNSLKDLPPVNLKDPFAARVPLSSRPAVSTIWAPPTILPSPRRLAPRIITMSTTTTTGSGQHQPLQVQFDNQMDDTIDAHATRPSLQRKSSRIPLRRDSLQNNKQPATQSIVSQANPADIAISSEHLLTPTKLRTARLCHTASPEGEKVGVKITPISISTSHPTHEMVPPAARIAFLSPFQNLRHRVAMKKAENQKREDSLTPPKTRKPVVEVGNVSPKAKGVQGGQGGIGDPSSKLGDPDAYGRQMNGEYVPGRKEDGLMVWHPSPSAKSNKPATPSPSQDRCPHGVVYYGSSPGSPRRLGRVLTSDQKYGIVRRENGSSSIIVGGSSPQGARKALAITTQVSKVSFLHLTSSFE
jgi:hypothetical protein